MSAGEMPTPAPAAAPSALRMNALVEALAARELSGRRVGPNSPTGTSTTDLERQT